MSRILLLLFVALLSSACANSLNPFTEPPATTPMPTEELKAIGAAESEGKSYAIAMETAEKFCHRWRAAPSVVEKEVRYQGKLKEDTQTAVNVARDVAAAAGEYVPFIGSEDAYETTLTYRCY